MGTSSTSGAFVMYEGNLEHNDDAWIHGAPLSIDLDSTICETCGLAKEGARQHSYTGQRSYHPLLAVAAGTGDVLLSRLREGRANTARGAAHFLSETVSIGAGTAAKTRAGLNCDIRRFYHAVSWLGRRITFGVSFGFRNFWSPDQGNKNRNQAGVEIFRMSIFMVIRPVI